jgi:hypothetical protein
MSFIPQAIWLLCTGAREASFRNIKSIAECLADELVSRRVFILGLIVFELFPFCLRSTLPREVLTVMLSRRRMNWNVSRNLTVKKHNYEVQILHLLLLPFIASLTLCAGNKTVL